MREEIKEALLVLIKNATPAEKREMIKIIHKHDERNEEYKKAAERIIDFLNLKAKRKYRKRPVNTDLIVARLREGITEAQLRQIVAKKCREWMGTNMQYCLRPKTLFNLTNCEQYVGELT